MNVEHETKFMEFVMGNYSAEESISIVKGYLINLASSLTLEELRIRQANREDNLRLIQKETEAFFHRHPTFIEWLKRYKAAALNVNNFDMDAYTNAYEKAISAYKKQAHTSNILENR